MQKRYNDFNSNKKETCYGLTYTSKNRGKSDSLYKNLSINAEIFTRKRVKGLRHRKKSINQCQENLLCWCRRKKCTAYFWMETTKSKDNSYILTYKPYCINNNEKINI